MKLPANKTERKKVIVLIVIVGVALLYSLVTFVIKPNLAQWRRQRAEFTELETRLSDARKETRQVQTERSLYQTALQRIEERSITGNHLARARLGNYRIAAEEILQGWARSAGVTLTEINEVGLTEFPQPATRTSRNALRGYVVRVTLSCGFTELLKLLHEIETANPLVCLVRLAVSANNATPQQHLITLEVQWPTWATQEIQTRVAERVAKRETGKE